MGVLIGKSHINGPFSIGWLPQWLAITVETLGVERHFTQRRVSIWINYWIIGLLIQDVSSVVDIGYLIVGEAGVQQKQGVSSDVLPRCWTATQKRAI